LPTVQGSLDLAPGEALAVADSEPLVIEATAAQPAPAALGNGAWSGHAVGLATRRYVWQGGAFASEGWVATLNCLSGTVEARTIGSAPILLFRCPDGANFAAARLTDATVFSGGLPATELRPGDDVQLVLTQAVDGSAAPSLPVAARLDSPSAEARYLAAAVPMAPPPTASPPPALRPEPVATLSPAVAASSRTSNPVTVPTPERPAPVVARPTVIATPPPTAPPEPTSAPATVVPTAVVTVTLAPARTVPPQPTATATVRTVPPQPQ